MWGSCWRIQGAQGRMRVVFDASEGAGEGGGGGQRGTAGDGGDGGVVVFEGGLPEFAEADAESGCEVEDEGEDDAEGGVAALPTDPNALGDLLDGAAPDQGDENGGPLDESVGETSGIDGLFRDAQRGP